MELVCIDAGPSKWVYDAATDIYTRLYPDETGVPPRRIMGKFLPNPEEVWASKVGKAQIEGRQANINGLKPTDAVYALWRHRQKKLLDGKQA